MIMSESRMNDVLKIKKKLEKIIDKKDVSKTTDLLLSMLNHFVFGFSLTMIRTFPMPRNLSQPWAG